jgi:hypothetical protein
MSVSFAYQRKRALIIGINEYPHDPLHYCVNDATDLKTTLQRINFDVTLGLNVNFSEFSRTIDTFANTIQRNDLVLFYFAGHGKQMEDQNYLLPLDYHYDHGGHERDYITHHAINVQHITKKIDDRKCRTTIYIFDCCRFLVRTGAINPNQGVISMNVPLETFIVYTCVPGKAIQEETGNNRNGSFIQNFLKHIETSGKDIEEIMRNVARDVNIQTGGAQLPYRTSSLTDKVCLVTNNEQG